MAHNNWRNGQLSGFFRAKHIVDDPKLRYHLLNQDMNQDEKLTRLKEFINEMYEDQLLYGPPEMCRWRVFASPIERTITLILRDAETITQRLREGIQVNSLPIIIQTQRQLPMIRIRIVGYGPIPDAKAIINWADPAVGATVTVEDFAASVNPNGEFYELVNLQ